MQSLQAKLLERIANGIKRKTITTPSKWAENYRTLQTGPWSFERFPWLREMHDCKAELCVGQKAAQMGYTETMLNLTFFCIDVLGRDVLYVLPNKNPDASDFSSGRFDPALELSPHLQKVFNDVNNIGHKRAGSANLYIRGSQSRSGLKSLPISRLFLDEVAEFNEDNIPLAFERVSGQLDKQIWMISTPNLEGFGISIYYDLSDKRIFTFKCPSCSRWENLTFPESVINIDVAEDCRLICKLCKNVLPHEDKKIFLRTGQWQPTEANKDWAGFTISQLYSTTVTPKTIAISYQNAQTNEADEVEFYNSKLGICHTVEGASVQDADITKAIVNGPKHHRKQTPNSDHYYVLGVDVGRVLYYEVDRLIIRKNQNINYLDINAYTDVVVEDFGRVNEIGEIDELFNYYNIVSAVIDANPERRMAIEFARRHQGIVKMCFFTRGLTGRSISYTAAESVDEPFINVDRTSWLDLALGRFRNESIYLPADTNMDYRQQIQQPVKTYTKDDKGQAQGFYKTKANKDDHYAFSRCYAEIAQTFLGRIFSNNEDITVEV